MSRKTKIIVSESTTELDALYSQSKNHRTRLKIKSLILFKENKYKNQEQLAVHLCIGYSTLRLWLNKYSKDGLASFIEQPRRGHPKSCITPEIHNALKEKLNESTDPLKGYWEAVEWVKKEFGTKVGYQALRNYMIKHFKTKLKAPRKSHYKKDEIAIEAFLKTT